MEANESDDIPQEWIQRLLTCPEFGRLGNLLLTGSERQQKPEEWCGNPPSRNYALGLSTNGLESPPPLVGQTSHEKDSSAKSVSHQSHAGGSRSMKSHDRYSSAAFAPSSDSQKVFIKNPTVSSGESKPSSKSSSKRRQPEKGVVTLQVGEISDRGRKVEGRDDEKPYTPDFENSVIQKQRKELQQLVSELRERDRELNDLVAGHQRQMGGWEADRRKLLQVEEKSRKLENELNDKQNQIKTLLSKLEVSEERLQSRNVEITRYQARMESLGKESGQHKNALLQIEEQNEALEHRMQQLASTIEHLEGKEQELKTELRVKDTELHKREQEVHDLMNRWKMAEEALKSHNQSFETLNQQLMEADNCLALTRQENDSIKAESSKLTDESRECLNANEKLQNEIVQLRKDHQLAIERERRKDELIQSQKLKQDRSNSELSHLRQVTEAASFKLYERMQRDLSTLQMSVENSRGLMTHQQQVNQRRSLAEPIRSENFLTNGGPPMSSLANHDGQMLLSQGAYRSSPSSPMPMQKLPLGPASFTLARPASAASVYSSRLANATSATNQLLEKLVTSRSQPSSSSQSASSPSAGSNLLRMTSMPDIQNGMTDYGNQPLNSSCFRPQQSGPSSSGNTFYSTRGPLASSTNPFVPSCIVDNGEDISQKLNRIMCQ